MNDRKFLIRLGIKSGLNPMNTDMFHEFIEQVGKCQNPETCDGSVDPYSWEMARDVKAAIFELRNSQTELEQRLHRLETLP